LGRVQGDGRPQLEGHRRRDGARHRHLRGHLELDRDDRAQARLMTALVFVILVALAFDFFNGFHDAANEIATVVSTRVLSPRIAVRWASLWHLVAVVLGTKVAATIAKDIVTPEVFTVGVVFSGLLGAILWDLSTW